MARRKTIFPPEYNLPFPSRLRQLMEMTHTTHADLGNAIGKARQAVGDYADGTSSPDWQTLVAISNYFSVSTDYLLGKTDVMTSISDVRSVCEYTGLREDLVKKLHSLHETGPNDPKFLNALYHAHEYELLYYRFWDYSASAQLNELKNEISKCVYDSIYSASPLMAYVEDENVDIPLMHDHILTDVLAMVQEHESLPDPVKKMLIAENQLHASMNRNNVQLFDVCRNTFTRSFDDVLRQYESSIAGEFSSLEISNEIQAAIEHLLEEYHSFSSEQHTQK